MIDVATVTAGLEPVRAVLQADGGDIEVVGVDGDSVSLRLIVEGSECAECVLPRPMLEVVALDLMKPLVPGLAGVVIEDPREG
jgi:Fe-S cluster biogenesis protein NfuA